MIGRISAGLGIGALAIGLMVPAQKKVDPPKEQNWVSFSRDIAPIFKAACNSCHMGKEAYAGLDLTKPETFVKMGVVKPGDPEKSVLLRRIKGLDGLPQMPKGFKPIDPEKVRLVSDWIKNGAKIDNTGGQHWAYVAPVKPEVPTNKLKWGSNEIDAFTLEKMTAQGLQPSAEATKEALARRVYLDLLGLPPTVEELDAFLLDTTPNAYEKLVDKLLASKHYGERQARMWLDLSRYADTNGYEADHIRTAWVYRDWVINAFNKNMPYDQFTIDQLAGDMLPQPKIDQLVATGFHRNSMKNEEGGVDPAESFYTMVIDRVATTSSTWLGSTLQCARCHDHKFDPFSQKDFFKLYAVFSNIDYKVEGNYKTTYSEHWNEPVIKVPSNESEAALVAKKKQIADLEGEKKNIAKTAEDYTKWRAAAAKPVEFVDAKIESLKAVNGTTLTVVDGNVIEASGTNPDQEEYQITFDLPAGNYSGLKLDLMPVPGKPSGRADGSMNFTLTDIGFEVDGQKIDLPNGRADFVQEGYNIKQLLAGKRESLWAVYPEGDKPHRLVLQFGKTVMGGKGLLKLGFHSRFIRHNIGRFKVSFSQAEYPILDVLKDIVAKLIAMPQGIGEPKLQDIYFLTSPAGAKYQNTIEDLKASMMGMEESLPTALVVKEKPAKGKLTAAVHHRGEFTSPGEPVEAGTPDVFPKPTSTANMNRLEFAKWLVDGRNPLTARVEVNRIWEQYFGRGIVETMDDFGTQGSLPSHPKLLDWLSVKFVESKWDMKAINKMIVMSATYRQTSNATKDALEKDPTNLYLARGPRFRMEAEMIRDTALQVSNLLNPKVGGASVMPYQPTGIWDSPYNGEQWSEMKSNERFRRGIYVFTKRTAMYPSFMSFDAGTRENCTVRRTRTNTPLQALTLLNDLAYVEAAKALGVKMHQRGTLEQGIVYGFRAATGRKPSKDELAVLAKAYGNFKDKYAKNPEAAKKLGSDDREAAWTMMGNVLLNLDETITKG